MKTEINGTTLRVVRLPNWLASVVRFWWGALQHDAFTVGHTVFVVRREPFSKALLAHESAHAKQVEAIRAPWPLDVLVFEARYAVETIRHGYWSNKFEIAARAEKERFMAADVEAGQ